MRSSSKLPKKEKKISNFDLASKFGNEKYQILNRIFVSLVALPFLDFVVWSGDGFPDMEGEEGEGGGTHLIKRQSADRAANSNLSQKQLTST